MLPFIKTVRTDVVKNTASTRWIERKGFSDERIETLKEIYRILVSPRLNTSQAVERIEADFSGNEDAAYIVEFIRTARRGVHK